MSGITFAQIKSLNPCSVINDVEPWFTEMGLEGGSLLSLLDAITQAASEDQSKKLWCDWFKSKAPSLGLLTSETYEIRQFMLSNPLTGQHETFPSLAALTERRKALVMELAIAAAQFVVCSAEVQVGNNTVLQVIPYKD